MTCRECIYSVLNREKRVECGHPIRKEDLSDGVHNIVLSEEDTENGCEDGINKEGETNEAM